MQILKELWIKDREQPETKTVHQHILEQRSWLEDTCKFAQKELAKVRVKQKRLYDSHTRLKVNKNLQDHHSNKGQREHILYPTKSH